MTRDLKSSVSVFLVALPLCLGLAIASGAPPIAGIIAGVVGGIVVGFISNSPVSVSGPAAGLTIVVLEGIDKSGGFEQFLTVLVVSGIIQILFACFRGGVIGNFFPGSVINGLLTSIGLLLLLKQFPHAVGYDPNHEVDFSFSHAGGENTFTGILSALNHIEIQALLTFLVSLGCMLLFNHFAAKGRKFATAIPAPLVAVIVGTAFNATLGQLFPGTKLDHSHLVQLPAFSNLMSSMSQPLWSMLTNPVTYTLAFTLAIISSLETLLNIDGADKLDPQKRITSRNRELLAQGVGNITSGLLGGLPVTSVVVRSTVNVSSGARSKKSTIFHGFLLILSIFMAAWINLIPLSALAAILMVFGFKLAHPKIFKKFYNRGYAQFVPFMITIVAILMTNLLVGVMIGMLFGLAFVIRSNFHSAILVVHDGPYYLIRFQKDVSFLNKSKLREIFSNVPAGSHLILDGSKTVHIDQDILDTIEEFLQQAKFKRITFEIKRSTLAASPYFKELSDDNDRQTNVA
ncbi:MAG: SulP family inorganic anion transporter [Proteobacteria bacterium]|jgi:MFS superfamily sulfate permease-like transporter|nr:SulP family inorganic anion transporter [Pseudomonadota bacterium]